MSHSLEGATIRVNFHCNTGGDGLWSTHVASVRVTALVIGYVASHDDNGADLEEDAAPVHGELQVGFDTKTWNPDEHGLIYTDRQFYTELREELIKLGFSKFAADNVGYSEQGMQGDDYVSFDVGMVFLAEARAIFAS
jgi:hypothetical protein